MTSSLIPNFGRVCANVLFQLDMTDGDVLEVHQEQIGGAL